MAGTRSQDKAPLATSFDVEAAFQPDFDFDALFAADDEVVEPAPRVRVGHRRIAFAMSVTIAALPLLFLDNFQATADTPAAQVDAEAAAEPATTARPEWPASTEAPVTDSTLPAATVFVADPTTSTTAAPTTTTTKAAPTTTATPKIAAIAAPTTTTTRPPAPTTTLPPAPATTAPQKRVSSTPDPDDGATWDALARCEANGNWSANTGNGYYGGLQFSLSTWHDQGGDGYPHQASRARQIEVGRKLYDRSGWSAWPGCARKLGWT